MDSSSEQWEGYPGIHAAQDDSRSEHSAVRLCRLLSSASGCSLTRAAFPQVRLQLDLRPDLLHRRRQRVRHHWLGSRPRRWHVPCAHRDVRAHKTALHMLASLTHTTHTSPTQAVRTHMANAAPIHTAHEMPPNTDYASLIQINRPALAHISQIVPASTTPLSATCFHTLAMHLLTVRLRTT